MHCLCLYFDFFIEWYSYLMVVFRKYNFCHSRKSKDGLFGIATGFGLDGQGSLPGRSKKFFSTPQRPDQLWGPPSLLCNGYQGSFPEGKAAGAWSWPLASIYCQGQECGAVLPLLHASSWRSAYSMQTVHISKWLMWQ
jgi:hypothetical protein